MEAPIARRGIMLVLSSPSGAGKTTIINMVLGVLEPTAARSRLNSHTAAGKAIPG